MNAFNVPIEPVALAILPKYLGEPNRALSTRTELRWGRNGSMAVDLVKQTWWDHEEQQGGGVIDLLVAYEGLNKAEAVRWLRDHGFLEAKPNGQAVNGHAAPPFREVAHYAYTDEVRNLIFQVVRLENGLTGADGKREKTYRQRKPDGNGGWTWSTKGIQQVPYRLPELIADIEDGATIFIVEGEKKVDLLRANGIPATCNAGGAGKWRAEHSELLRGVGVVILPDNDRPGRKHAEVVSAALSGVAESVRVVDLSQDRDLPAKGDVVEWWAAVRAEHDPRERLYKLANSAQVAAPKSKAEATPKKFQNEKEARVGNRSSETPAIDGARVLNSVAAFLGRFVAYPSEAARVAHTLWIAHTHLMDAWESTPRIAFLSPEPGSGKTRALEISELLVPRPVEAVNVTPAYLFRKVGGEDGAPTILFDEIDTIFGPKAKDNEEIRGLLNAGHRRGAVAGHCVVKGRAVVTEEIPAFCAVALAGIGDLPDTILTRSVVVRMRRRSPDEHIDAYRRRVHSPEGEAIRADLAKWGATVVDRLTDAWPELPKGIHDRDADVWEPLLAIADAAGGDWPDRARVAAVALVALSKESTPSLGVRLLCDLRTVFADDDVLATESILVRLRGLDESPWAEIDGKELNDRGLARRLRPYGVGPKVVRIGSATPRGYVRTDFADAWKRYLHVPRHDGATSATSTTSTPSTPSTAS
jgi:5S rRNA maturation endonuclease (ribonuclease M5)